MFCKRFTSCLVFAAMALNIFVAGCGSDSSPSQPKERADGGVEISVDTAVQPSTPALPVAPGSDPRPLAAVESGHGHTAEFVEDELWISPLNDAELDAFMARWDGEIVGKYDPADVGLGGDRVHYLVRVDASAADRERLPDTVAALSGSSEGSLRFSSESGVDLVAAGAAEAAAGLEVGLNWVGRGSSFLDSATDEAPAGDPAGYTPDSFGWASHAVDNSQDIGVAEAWRMLEIAGKTDNRVKVAILDMGFSAINDISSSYTLMSNVPWVTNPLEQSNLLNCGGPCPWHGNNVASAAMALPDDSYGAAGPAGPIADPILVFTLYDYFTSIGALGMAYAAGADVASMSYGAPVPGVLAWTALPFELATLGFRDAGMLIFASAGNDGADVDDESCFIVCWENTLYTPCENGGVICVGGLSYDSQNRAGNSNYGSGSVDIFAPYTLLVGPDPDRPANYANFINGTSFSSPFAAGVAALIWAADPGLSAGEVEGILFATAHTSPDGRVNRYVNAADAVRMALGDAPPFIEITSPVSGSSYPRGSSSVSFAADAEDLEDGTPTVSWISNIDGSIGTGTFFSKTDLSSGTHVITAIARDGVGNESRDQVTVTITNTAPMLTIDSPSHGAAFFESQSISLQGSSYDPNELGPLHDGDVSWWVGTSYLASGHSKSIAATSLGVGTHTIYFRGSDGDLSGEDSIQLTVQADPKDVPPSVAIYQPANGSSVYVDSYDSVRGEWYIELAFLGTASDPEDGMLNGTDVVWKAQAQGHPVEILGTGTSITARLYSKQPFGTSYTITLEATDSAGNTSSTSISMVVNILS